MSGRAHVRWSSHAMAGAYRELDHPADLLLEVHGGDRRELVERSLFALYDSVVDVDTVGTGETWVLEAAGADLAEALRSLLAEALFATDTRGLVGAAALVEIGSGAGVENGAHAVALRATVRGEVLDPRRHHLRTEVKAVTYHRLRVWEAGAGDWRATFLLDV